MGRLVSTEFYSVINQISDQDFNPEHIFAIFRKEMPSVAPMIGIVLLKASIYLPIKRSSDMSVSNIELYDITNGEESNNIEFGFPISDGGRVVVVSGIAKNDTWTDEKREDNFILSKMIYLLVGRANTMSTLSNLMFFDQLTGIPNETGLSRYMAKTISEGTFSNYSTNFLNIKNMKLMNSRYSEAAGNAVMLGYAKAVSSYAEKNGNGIAARLGGDNFLAFIESAKEEEFLEFVRNIEVPFTKADGKEIRIKVDSRLGYYNIKPGDGINEAMRNSDVAVKLARKTNYPDCVMFEENMKTHLLKMRQLEQNIPNAIENKEFVVYYQPKVDISKQGSFSVNGAEALVRWVKDGEMVSPGEFVPLLEKSGLIALIDYYVLEQVCLDINDLISRGIKPVKVSSNFSRRHLQDSEFADKVESIIRKHNIDPKYIEIEITESYDDEDMYALMIFEKRMHSIGVDLAVDDFGCGFSSLKMIKNIVADTIKLDKSIIDGIGEGGADDIIISHIIKMINNLGKNIIAEGVETEKQASFLRENGCNNIQGFLFAKPCAKENYEKFLISAE